MSCCLSRVDVLSLAVSLMIVAGCSGRPARLVPPKMNASAAAAEAMTLYDTNKDGKISGNEFDQCSSLKEIAKDGEVTADMLVELLNRWQNGRIGRIGVVVKVLHNGKPLVGASVKAVPEKFLGTNFKPITGTTIAGGRVGLSVPTRGPEEPTGAAFGFYRIEVTKEGESIPAKYNTETTLSLAVIHEVIDLPYNLVY